MKRLQQEGDKLVEVEDKDNLAKIQNVQQDIAEDNDTNIMVDGSAVSDKSQ
jgi:hypothetical protein